LIEKSELFLLQNPEKFISMISELPVGLQIKGSNYNGMSLIVRFCYPIVDDLDLSDYSLSDISDAVDEAADL
jgi:hypothetical protein